MKRAIRWETFTRFSGTMRAVSWSRRPGRGFVGVRVFRPMTGCPRVTACGCHEISTRSSRRNPTRWEQPPSQVIRAALEHYLTSGTRGGRGQRHVHESADH